MKKSLILLFIGELLTLIAGIPSLLQVIVNLISPEAFLYFGSGYSIISIILTIAGFVCYLIGLIKIRTKGRQFSIAFWLYMVGLILYGVLIALSFAQIALSSETAVEIFSAFYGGVTFMQGVCEYTARFCIIMGMGQVFRECYRLSQTTYKLWIVAFVVYLAGDLFAGLIANIVTDMDPLLLSSLMETISQALYVLIDVMMVIILGRAVKVYKYYQY